MATSYDVTAKQFNGVDYDDIYFRASDSFKFGGVDYQTFTNLINQNIASASFTMGTYIGDGSATREISVGKDFDIVFIQRSTQSASYNTTAMATSLTPVNADGNKIEVGNKKIVLTGNSAYSWNFNQQTYAYAVIKVWGANGGAQYLISQSGQWTVPFTGKYDIELHGGGGGAYGTGEAGSASPNGVYTGGGSGEIYRNVNLTKGQVVDVVIGSGGLGSRGTSQAANGGETSFGTYKIAGGVAGAVLAPGASVGSLGKSGGAYTGTNQNNWLGGTGGSSVGAYGDGGNGETVGYTSPVGSGINYYYSGKSGQPGAVIIRFLGA